MTTLGELEERFRLARGKYTAGGRQPNHINVEDLVDELRNVAVDAVYTENNEGANSRGAVSAVARILGVDIISGHGHMWDRERMQRVIDGAKALQDDRDHWEQEATNWRAARDTWKALAEQHDADLAPTRSKLRTAERERDVAVERSLSLLTANHELHQRLDLVQGASDVDELKATIVRQANEITALKGESE